MEAPPPSTRWAAGSARPVSTWLGDPTEDRGVPPYPPALSGVPSPGASQSLTRAVSPAIGEWAGSVTGRVSDGHGEGREKEGSSPRAGREARVLGWVGLGEGC